MKLINISLILFAFIFSGCVTQNRDLDPTGPYGGDKILYEADNLILQVSAIFNDIEDLAQRNPGFVGTNEDFRNFVNQLRSDKKQWLTEALAARDLYAQTKSQVDLKSLEGKLAFLRQILIQANRYLITQS